MLKDTTNHALVDLARAFSTFKFGVELDTLEDGAEEPSFTVIGMPTVSLYARDVDADFTYLRQMVSPTFMVTCRYKDGRLLCQDYAGHGVELCCIVKPDPEGKWKSCIIDHFMDWFDPEDARA